VSYWIHTGHLYIDGYKMSKSLKNFITIENYLQGKWSLSTSVLTSDGLHPLYKDPWTAAADLRIFFLQHKYHSTLYLSDVTLQEAANWRMKLENLLQLTHPQNMATQLADLTNPRPDDVRAQRWTAESTELYDRLIQTKQEIHTALSEDFNTPVVLSHLSKLSTLVETYYMHYPLQKKMYSIDPIPAVRAYVVDMITLFGLIVQESKSPQQVLSSSSPPSHHLFLQSSLVRVSIHGSKSLSSGESGGGEGGDHEGPLLSPVIDSLVSFRGDVRMKSLAALKEIKSLKKKTSSSSPSVFSNEQYQELLSSYERAVSGIMSACDDTRNQLSGGMGIEIHDLHEKTMWKMNPKRKEE
jgi:cysteinyl-tRNA synthetase